MTVILMSRSEIDRMNVLRDLAEERIRVSEAATLIGLGRRQVLRLAKAFRQRGPAALASRRRGKPSNRSYPGVLRTEVTGIIRERYADFGPTLAGEKLAELHGIRLARETIRQWMMVAGLWKDRRQRMRPVHQPRHRRGLHWRADPDRRIATLVVRGARTAMHVAGLYRRRDEPVDASAVCGDGVDV